MKNEIFSQFASRLVRAAAIVTLGVAVMAPAAQAQQVEMGAVTPNTTTVTITDVHNERCNGQYTLTWTSNPTYPTYEIWSKVSTAKTYTLYSTEMGNNAEVVAGFNPKVKYDFKVKAGTTFSNVVVLAGYGTCP